VKSLRRALEETRAALEQAKAAAAAAKAAQLPPQPSPPSPSPPPPAVDTAWGGGAAAMMREVRTLQGRLQECTLQRLAPEQRMDATQVDQGIELLAISDNRISCLIAETQLLLASEQDGASGGSGGDAGGEEELQAAVRQAFAELLVENAQLRKTHNSLLRNALVQGASQGGVEAASHTQSLLRRFL
jgi:hypothetical protein